MSIVNTLPATQAVLHLRTAIKSYPHTEKIISGELTVPGIALDCQEIEPIHHAFAPMARTQAYDVSELAIVTYLQAKAYGKPLILLPSVLAARLQQGCLVYNARHGEVNLANLAGKRVGVRAYTQTTGMWVRAILAGTYGIPSKSINWITFEDGHLTEYRDPDFVTRSTSDQGMLKMLRSGAIDAAIFGNDLPKEEGILPVIANHAEADRLWQQRNGFVPVNHVAVMHRAVAERHPESVKAVYALLRKGKDSLASPDQVRQRVPDGIDALRGPLEMILACCEEQQLLPRKLTVDEIFADCLEFLGDAAR